MVIVGNVTRVALAPAGRSAARRAGLMACASGLALALIAAPVTFDVASFAVADNAAAAQGQGGGGGAGGPGGGGGAGGGPGGGGGGGGPGGGGGAGGSDSGGGGGGPGGGGGAGGSDSGGGGGGGGPAGGGGGGPTGPAGPANAHTAGQLPDQASDRAKEVLGTIHALFDDAIELTEEEEAWLIEHGWGGVLGPRLSGAPEDETP